MSIRCGLHLLTLLTTAHAVAANSLPPAPSGVEVTSEYGIEFVTIGDPGNRTARRDEFRYDFTDTNVGAVVYEYRMARTEVTIGQWFEFVRAYDQFNDPPRVNDGFSGHGIEWDFAGQQWYTTLPLCFPTTMNWEYAARYCNWLTNNKALTAEAFERGAYDTSTFTYNPDGSSNYQESHSPGARFWIPSRDEWVKSVYWDPNKDNGEGGYWYYPGASNDLLILGPPGVGETNGGSPSMHYPVGSYSGTMMPWGLLDASGGVREWGETVRFLTRWRVQQGSFVGDGSREINDAIEFHTSTTPGGLGDGRTGLRIAAAVPSPSAVSWILLFVVRTRRGGTRCFP